MPRQQWRGFLLCDQLENRDSLFIVFQIKTAVSVIVWYPPSKPDWHYCDPRLNDPDPRCNDYLNNTMAVGLNPVYPDPRAKTSGTKRKDRIRGYGGNDSEMYSQWYQHFDDNSTQGKSRRGIRSSSKDDDYLQGGKGRDKLRGGKGDDELQGQRGHDHLRGGKGDDYLIGGDGNDYLKGGKGDDILIGGKGNDKLIGGKGADIFDVKSDTEKGSKCIIKDFNPDEGDKISAADNVSIEMKGDKAIIEADGATTICRLDSDYRPNNAPVFRDWFTDPTSTIVDVVEG